MELANKAEFIRLIVGKADSSQVNYLTSEILRGHLNLFPRSDITDVLSKLHSTHAHVLLMEIVKLEHKENGSHSYVRAFI